MSALHRGRKLGTSTVSMRYKFSLLMPLFVITCDNLHSLNQRIQIDLYSEQKENVPLCIPFLYYLPLYSSMYILSSTHFYSMVSCQLLRINLGKLNELTIFFDQWQNGRLGWIETPALNWVMCQNVSLIFNVDGIIDRRER